MLDLRAVRRTAARVLARLAIAGFILAGEAEAQRTATLTGRVTADSGGGSIGRVTIRIPELGRVAATDSTGAFRVEELPPGTYSVIAEAPGFRARLARVALTPDAATSQNFALTRGAQVLAAVDVRAKAPPRVSLKMLDFERRRQRGLGRFVTREELQRYGGRQLEEVLRSAMPGLRFVKTPYGQTWLISSRQAATSASLLLDPQSGAMQGGDLCHVQVILDGAFVSGASFPRVPRARPQGGERTPITDVRTQTQGGDDPIDLSMFISDQLEGVEYYADATMTPVQYRTAGSACGTLLLWTRDR